MNQGEQETTRRDGKEQEIDNKMAGAPPLRGKATTFGVLLSRKKVPGRGMIETHTLCVGWIQ